AQAKPHAPPVGNGAYGSGLGVSVLLLLLVERAAIGAGQFLPGDGAGVGLLLSLLLALVQRAAFFAQQSLPSDRADVARSGLLRVAIDDASDGQRQAQQGRPQPVPSVEHLFLL